MIDAKSEIIRNAVAEGTGARIEIKTDTSGLQTAVQLWFSDLRRSSGPSVLFGPAGLKRHSVTLSFGNFSGPVLEQIARADEEEVLLSRALLRSINDEVSLVFPDGTDPDEWEITGPGFTITAERRRIEEHLGDDALEQTCNNIVVPLMAAMAELIGYDEILPEEPQDEPAWEGAEKRSVIKRRERNPRNRLLCLRIHGYSCKICGTDPRQIYGEAGAILEVHHLEPLAQQQTPRVYDPETDLIPLCPNCHRVVHSRRPVPWTPQEISGKIANV